MAIVMSYLANVVLSVKMAGWGTIVNRVRAVCALSLAEVLLSGAMLTNLITSQKVWFNM